MHTVISTDIVIDTFALLGKIYNNRDEFQNFIIIVQLIIKFCSMKPSAFQKQQSSADKSKINSSQQYVSLVVKQLKKRRTDFVIQTKPIIESVLRKYSTDASLLMEIKKNPHRKQEILFQIIQQLKNDNEVIKYGESINEIIHQKAQQLSSIPSRQTTFVHDCFREAMSFPIKKQHENIMYNFLGFYKKNLTKQLRRILWQKLLVSEKTKQMFFKYDHEVTPYNIDMEFKVTLDKIAQIQNVWLKQNQKDVAIRLLQYVVKSTGNLPNRIHMFMVLSLIQLFSFYGPNKSLELGSIYCGLTDLANYYYEPNLDKRLINILKAIQLIDYESYELIIKYFFNQELEYTSKQEINEMYQHFRMSLGSKFLDGTCSQYLIDQILIKKRSIFDMYVLFAMTIMILGEQLQAALTKQPSKTSNKNNQSQQMMNKSQIRIKMSVKNMFQKSKMITIKDIMTTYQILYQKIPAIYSNQNPPDQPNKLFEYLLAFQGQHEQEKDQKQNLEQDYSQKLIEGVQEDFVQTSKQKYRLGKKQ